MAWIAPPDEVTWTLAKPITFGSQTYSDVTLRCPTAADVLKASAIRGSSFYEITLRMIAALSEVPYEALTIGGGKGLPSYVVEQMSRYLDSFNEAPLPGPLQPPADSAAGSE